MPEVTYIEHDGTVHTVEARLDRSLMQTALDHGVAGILGDFGGTCSCGTCHVYVDPTWANKLAPKSETEVFMLEGVPEPRPESRLSCQIRMSAELAGFVLRLPAEQG